MTERLKYFQDHILDPIIKKHNSQALKLSGRTQPHIYISHPMLQDRYLDLKPLEDLYEVTIQHIAWEMIKYLSIEDQIKYLQSCEYYRDLMKYLSTEVQTAIRIMS